MFSQSARQTPVLTATVRGPTEEFQKFLTSSPSSASDLVFPAEKRPFACKTTDARTYCWKTAQVGQNLPFWLLYVGASVVW